MAEDGTELRALETQLQLLLGGEPPRGDGQRFCAHFCTLVEQQASRCRLPVPQLRVLQVALCYFSRAWAGFSSPCDHVLHTVSSLALSIFELLLFFEQRDFEQEPLRHFSVTFQECHSALWRLQNVHLLQVERAVRQGGPWASPALQAILREDTLPQKEVDGFIGSELPVFLELRVLYLLSCQRVPEAMALARRCARHPVAGRHAFFLQVYLTWLCKTTQLDRLHREVAGFNGKDAVHIICSLESEEDDELLLALCTAFLSQQLRRGDLYYLCDLVFVWTKLHSRLKTPMQAMLAESQQLMQSATNISSIFPFIRAILPETGEAGVQFCVELCANALQSRLPCDATTKTLIYKTIAGLLPGDLEVCRACALLVFFLERSVEAYKTVYLLYLHPDQEYHVDCCPIGNRVRFETLQILKKDLCFDPEFWNLMALRTSCLKLMSEKVVSAALEEIMEDKWISSYCTKESSTRRRALQTAEKKRRHRDQASDATSKRLKAEPDGKRRGCRTTRPLKEAAAQPLRRSFWQLDRLRDNGEHRRTTRLSEKSTQKRRIRTPRWLLEDSGTLENNAPLKMKKHGLREHKNHRPAVVSRSHGVPFKNGVRHKNLEGKTKENGVRHQKGFPSDGVKAAPAPQVVLELSLPDNELLFTEDACSRQRGIPPVLLYRPTIKLPEASPPAKSPHGREVILRARDAAMLVQQLHCYARRVKGRGLGLSAHGSVSTITRSSAQGSPPKDPPPEPCSRPEAKGGEPPQVPAARTVLRKLSSARETSQKSTEDGPGAPDCEEPAVEMKVTFASQSPVLERVCKAGEQQAPPSSAAEENPPVLDKVTDTADREEAAPEGGDEEQRPQSSLPTTETHPSQIPSQQDSIDTSCPATDQEDFSALMPGTEMVPQLLSEQFSTDPDHNQHQDSGNGASEEPTSPHKVPSTSSCSPSLHEVSLVGEPGSTRDSGPRVPEDEEPVDSEPETEESKLDYCCTFCNKDFKGRRVVEHAMFHYRRDECMFCGLAFRDDLLAMMHLSDHIEKLKRLKDSPGSRVKASTKDTSAKAQPKNTSSGRPRKSAVCPKPSRPRCSPDSNRLRSRMLRSNSKPADEKQAAPKPTVLKLNGHTGRGKELKRLKHNLKAKTSQETQSDGAPDHKLRKHKDVAPKPNRSSEDQERTSPSPQVPKTNTKPNRKAAEEKAVAPEEKVHCQVDGCSWSADLSKSRVALLYHALEEHPGHPEPLKLAFSKGNGKCTICMRVLWSFEHFRHHVERHRLTPRHPCLHQGCAARFKTGMEMRRHTRKHSPLQAACCLPGCSRLFICLWALNLHEREHYARKSRDTDGGGAENPPSPEQAQHHPPKHKAGARAPKHHQSADSNVLKNLSNKHASADTAAPLLRLRLRKAASSPPKVHRVVSSLMKRCRKVRHKLTKQQVSVDKGPRRRGRPPKTRRDENTAGLRETVTLKSKKGCPQPPPPSSQEQDDGTRRQIRVPGRPSQTPAGESRLRPPVKRSHLEEDLGSSGGSQPSVSAPQHKTPKQNATRRKSHTKTHKGAIGKVHKNHQVSSTLERPVKTTSAVLQPQSTAGAGGEGSNEEARQTEPGDSKPAVLPATAEEPQSLESEDKLKTLPVPLSIEEPQSLESEDKLKTLPVPLSIEEPQSLESEDKLEALPVPSSIEEPRSLESDKRPKKLPVLPATIKEAQSLESEDKLETLPVPPSIENNQSLESEDKLETLPVPPSIENNQNLESEDKHNTLPVSLSIEEPQSLESEDKLINHLVPPTITQNNQNLQSLDKPETLSVPPITECNQSLKSENKHNELPVSLTTQRLQSEDELINHPVPPTTTEDHQSLQSEDKPKTLPLTTPEKPQSLQSDQKPKKRPVPPTTQKPKKLPVRPASQKPKKPKKLPVPSTTPSLQSDKKPKKLPVPPSTPSLQSDKKPKKLPVPPTIPSLQSDKKPKKLPVPPTIPSLQSDKKPKKLPVRPASHKPKKPKKVPIPPTTPSLQSEDEAQKLPVPPATQKPKKPQKPGVPPNSQKSQTLQSQDKPKKPRSKNENPSDGKKNKTADKKPAREKRPCKASVPSKCEVKQDGVSRPPAEGGQSIKSKAVKNRRKSQVPDPDDGVAAKKPRKDARAPPEAERLPLALQGAEQSSPPEWPPPPAAVVRRRASNGGNFSVCKETLERYSKKPYLRLPPTVYLDERYTAMPRRRKEPSPGPPEPQACPGPLQRHRCPTCFSTFHCDQELQGHRTLNKCSAFFGFDSDNDD
ncbi:uncharacterized protein LOC115385048 isoform X3 [Salarias fasciatus]|uniref:uncharacterized protein LOC115385048 isoform X3 n=1 Tax=Salarias fasciatus TaxID=181472 RepID=UPI001176DD10|nr:uncharacterized protein LOC115385048 isoform X3 [Salarias fasciatus]